MPVTGPLTGDGSLRPQSRRRGHHPFPKQHLQWARHRSPADGSKFDGDDLENVSTPVCHQVGDRQSTGVDNQTKRFNALVLILADDVHDRILRFACLGFCCGLLGLWFISILTRLQVQSRTSVFQLSIWEHGLAKQWPQQKNNGMKVIIVQMNLLTSETPIARYFRYLLYRRRYRYRYLKIPRYRFGIGITDSGLFQESVISKTSERTRASVRLTLFGSRFTSGKGWRPLLDICWRTEEEGPGLRHTVGRKRQGRCTVAGS